MPVNCQTKTTADPTEQLWDENSYKKEHNRQPFKSKSILICPSVSLDSINKLNSYSKLEDKNYDNIASRLPE